MIGAALLVLVPTGCGRHEARADLPGVSASAVVTRQRDLVERGLVNVMTHNGTGHDVLIVGAQLVASGLDAPPAASRTIKIAPDRTIAIQVPYGVAADCGEAMTVTATLEVAYRRDPNSAVRRGSIPLGESEVLSRLRAQQCAVELLAAATTITLVDPMVADGALAVTVRIELSDTRRAIVVGAARGTILVAARRHDASPVGVDRGHPSASIEVTFVVNRCDPHALAEVTKPYGLEFEVAIDAGPMVWAPVPIDTIAADLDAIVAECRARQDQ